MRTTHTLFYIRTSCLESQNEVLQDYVLRLALQMQAKTLSWDILSQHQQLSPSNQSIFASVESLIMKLLIVFLLS